MTTQVRPHAAKGQAANTCVQSCVVNIALVPVAAPPVTCSLGNRSVSDVTQLPVPLPAGCHLYHLSGDIGWSEFLEIMMHTLQQIAEDPDSGQKSYQVRQWLDYCLR